MLFTESRIVTGVVQRVSQKTGNPYTVVNYLNDDGSTFSTVAECEIPRELKQLDRVEVDFDLTVGRYTALKTVAMRLEA